MLRLSMMRMMRMTIIAKKKIEIGVKVTMKMI
jgi:hypothetical protein